MNCKKKTAGGVSVEMPEEIHTKIAMKIAGEIARIIFVGISGKMESLRN